MRIAIRHQISLTPPPGTMHAVMQLLLTPQSGPGQTVESWSVETPGIRQAARFTDAFGNIAHLVNQTRPEGDLVVTIAGLVETFDTHGVLGRLGGEPVPAIYRRITPLTKSAFAVHGKFRSSKDSRLDVLHALMARVGEVLGLPEEPAGQEQSQGGQTQSQGGQSQSQEQMRADGSAQAAPDAVAADHSSTLGNEAVAPLPLPPATDYAHAFIGAARALGIPARYVTGYLAADEDNPAAFHAWAEAYDEGLGWIGFDPMLQLCPTDRHVRLAVGLDALYATPLRAIPAGDGTRQTGLSVEAAQ